MLKPMLIEDIAVGSVSMASLVTLARPRLAAAITNRALRKAAPKAAQFKKDLLQPLTNTNLKNIYALSDALHSFEKIRSDAVSKATKLKAPLAAVPASLSEIKADILNIWDGVAGAVRRKYSHQINAVILEKAHFHAHAVKGATPTMEGFVDTHVAGLLDKAHLTTPVAALYGATEDIVGANIMEAVSEAHDILTPGVVSIGKSIVTEIKLFKSGQSDWEQTAVNIDIIRGKGLIIGLGIFADSCGAMGLGTLTSLIASKLWGNYWVGDAIKSDLEMMRPHLQDLNAAKIDGINAVNKTSIDNFKGIPALLRECPKASNVPSLHFALKRIGRAYDRDAENLYSQAVAECDQRVAAIPAKNWVDRALGIDRNKAVSQLFQRTAQEVIADVRETSQTLNRNLETIPHIAVEIFLTYPTPRGQGVEHAIQAAADCLQEARPVYASQMATWENLCAQKWNIGASAVAAECAAQDKRLGTLTSETNTILAPIRKRIRANLIRLKKDPALCP